MRILVACFVLAIGLATHSQPYQPNWESLDKRPVPAWFTNSKFGIFIHWGMYAVPGWCSKGNYAEWYQYGLQTNDTARQQYHKTKFGNRTYYDLARDFKAERFNPDEWAQLFEKSGAKYIVLTSKHHDGYTLWPSKEANQTWGFPWTSADVGPERDLLGDLFTAVRKTSVRAGMYYSLYEWFNPLWKTNKEKFVETHTWPQMKELINTYQPDVFWTDGDWDVTAEVWKSQQFLSWLYNESVVKDKVVVNDRWGSGIRFKHGGIFTPEYQPDLDFENHAWEESRGMGYSYGYNMEEDAWDYNSTRSLVLQLIDKVSRGGNFLLDIGPDEHGKIPPIMQERLLQIGEWLKINGEAIYNTTRWKTTAQWSAGRRDYTHRSGDMLLKITTDPDPGYAVKELFFTYNPVTNALYAISPKYPAGRKMLIKDMSLQPGTVIRFLSTQQKLSWKQVGKNIEVQLPEYDPEKIKAPYAYAVKIENYGKFAAKPTVTVAYNDKHQPVITMQAEENAHIYYTTDGKEPSAKSSLYQQPFTINTTAVVKAISIQPGALYSALQETKVKTYPLQPAAEVLKQSPGLQYDYFEAEQMNAAQMNTGTPLKTGVAATFTINSKGRASKFGFVFTGLIQIDKTGMYDFYTESDDGSMLWIDGEEVVNNIGEHGLEEKTGKAMLAKGLHTVKLLYYDSGGGNGLKVSYNLAGQPRHEIPAGVLFH